MIEKFSDYETGFLAETGTFEFEIINYELCEGNNGPVAHFEAKCDAGRTTLYQSLAPKARWSYNKLIKACMNLDTPEKIRNFELDYETIGNELINKKFIGVVEKENYEKAIKIPLDDGTFQDDVEKKVSYKIKEILPIK